MGSNHDEQVRAAREDVAIALAKVKKAQRAVATAPDVRHGKGAQAQLRAAINEQRRAEAALSRLEGEASK